ncbi:MAG: ChaN family lipoprotein [Rhizobiaceae bacterium]
MPFAILIAVGILACCVSAAPAKAQSSPLVPSEWTSQLHVDHPLIGKLFKGNGKPSHSKQLVKQAQLTRFVLIGEIHDNPDHHVIQANLIDAMASSSRGRRPSVVYEMVPRSLSREVARFDLTRDPKLDEFAKAVKWEERGWYSWDIYRPVALAAARNNLPMVAGNLDRELTRRISKTGWDALTQKQIEDFAVNTTLESNVENEFLDAIDLSHCGLMPRSVLPAMLKVQRARDGSMADAMIKSGLKFGSILIAGNGHVRKDRGVPLVLETLLPGAKTLKLGDLFGAAGTQTGSNSVQVRIPNAHNLAIGLIEVQPDRLSFADYELLSQDGAPIYDYVIFTPEFDDTDHCASLREQFKTTKKPENE